MKKFTIIISLLICCYACNSQKKEQNEKQLQKTAVATENKVSTGKIPADKMQSFSITEEAIKKDWNGKVISNKEFSTYMATGKYVLNPIVKDGKVVEAKLQKASPEQLEMIKNIMSDNKGLNKPAPDFEVEDIYGNHYKLSDLKDKTIVLNFWFTSCKPCVAEIPVLSQLVSDNNSNKDVIFLALATDKKKRVDTFLQKHPFAYHVIANSTDLAKKYKVGAFPTHFVIKNGLIVSKILGASENIKNELQKAIDEKPGKALKNVTPKQQIMLTPDSDIRNEKGEKLDMMKAASLINSQEYIMEQATDFDGKQYILIKKK
ncbi:TlpA family protein disulfide reductase [Marinifilum sp. D737]|uniref:TlpA family protein disulfide reductase n=1 Tax=Marinifilum sp. D737 TaxID=2969628 RepID=UPI002276B770|nr:TlpA disulfide reductase family protein [Marinifilum sp. D737]MCY1635922.1 TlpA family protein disulfide reductase [Marinifilum sp. D737]